MNLDKINRYLFIQICKYFLLILFIFLSVAWLLQLTRLFTISNFVHIEILDIILLSLYLIPNIITVIFPFILIFALLLCFIKLDRDNEIIAIFSLGLGLKPFKKTLVFFSLIVFVSITVLNFYVSPMIYNQYKNKEFELRNTLDFENMEYSNFLNLNKTTILDFKKENNEYRDIIISFYDKNENIVYAKKGNIFSKNNIYNFVLENGFKISINDEKNIERLEFLNYVLKVENNNYNNPSNFDKNTFTIFDDIYSKNYFNIFIKVIDVFLTLYIFFLFYRNNIKGVNFKSSNNIYFASTGIIILLLNQILKNSEIIFYNYILIIIGVILLSLIISLFKTKYE